MFFPFLDRIPSSIRIERRKSQNTEERKIGNQIRATIPTPTKSKREISGEFLIMKHRRLINSRYEKKMHNTNTHPLSNYNIIVPSPYGTTNVKHIVIINNVQIVYL